MKGTKEAAGRSATLVFEDAGARIHLAPEPDDPIGAVQGIFAGAGPSAAEGVRQLREEDLAAEEAKWARLYGRSERRSIDRG